MVLSIFTVIPLSASADETRYFEYKVLGDGTAEITGYTGIANIINIPSELDGHTVTSIGNSAFNGYSRMTEVTIPDTVTNIGQGAFWGCKGLTEVFIPESVMSISDSAFYDCTSITRFKVDGSNPAYRSLNGDLYDKSASTLIQYASGKTATSFAIPDSVINIKEGTFIFSCLTEITVPKSVRNIDDYAIGYYYNNNHMPAPIDGFVMKGFVGTAAKLYATDNDITFEALESDPNSDYQYTVLDDGTAEITRYKDYGSDIVIPPTLGGHFVTSIGNSAFYSKDTLNSLIIPDSVTRIGVTTFYNCRNLTKVTIPDSVITIGDEAFHRCRSLAEVTIPNSVTTIGDKAFYRCSSLTKVSISDSVTFIGEFAFAYCSKLIEVIIPNSVTNIGVKAFSNCTSLISITVDRSNNNYKSINGNLYDKTEATLIQYAIGKTATSFTINNSVTSIGDGAFDGCSSLTEVIIPVSVINIGEEAFDGCSNLTEVIIPNSVITIGLYAFGYDNYNNSENSWTIVKYDSFTIYGYPGTAAEQYANDNGFSFLALDDTLLGDVDSDSVVGVIDSTYIQRYDAGIRIPVSEKDMLARGDVDGDGEVGVIDATYIQRYDAGFNVPYSIGEPIV